MGDGKKKEKKNKEEKYTWVEEKKGKEKRKKKKKRKEGNMLRVYRKRIEKNEKSWYFESCEKINKIIRIY